MKAIEAPNNQTPQGSPSGGRSADIRGRFPAEPSWPGGDYHFPRAMERNWDVQAFTGYPVSTVWAGRWQRGQILRGATPAFVLPPGNPMWDRTDPSQWTGPRT